MSSWRGAGAFFFDYGGFGRTSGVPVMKSFGMRAMAEASKARERVKEAAANGAAFIESNLGTGTAGQLVVTSDSDDDGFPFGGAIGSARKPPRTPSSGRKNSSSEPTTPVGSNTPREDGVFVPTSSAVKLKFFDSNDMAGVVRAHLEEKMALAEEHEKLMLALERLVDGNREDARRRVQMLLPEEIKQAASAARETEHGANRVALVSALHELASLKKALANAQQMAEKAASAFTDDDTAATAGGHEKIAKEGSTDGWSDDGWSGDEHDETKTDDEKTLESLRQRIKTLEAQQAAERFTFLKRASALEAAGEITETAATDAVEEAERLLRVSEGEKHVLAEKVEALQIDLQTTREDLEKRETLDNAKKKSDSSKQRYEEVQVLESANVALEAALARAKREVIRLSGERESFVKQIESLSGTLETSKKKIDVLVVGNAAGENRVAALEKETKQFAIDLKTREAEKAELELEKAELEKAQSSVSASESDKLTTLETRQKETIKTLKKLTKGKTDAESKLESVSKKLETVLSELETVSKEKQASEAELKTLRETHEAAREAHKTVLAEHKTVLAEHETAAAAALETVTKESKDDSDSCDTIAQLKLELQSVLHAKSAAETAEAYAEEASAKDAETIAALKKTVDELRFSVNEAEKNLSATEVAEANAEEAAAASAIEAKALRGVVEDLKSQIAAHVSKKRNASKLNEALEMVKVELETARIGERSAETARDEALERIAALTKAQTKASIALDELTVQLAAAEKGRAEAEAKASSLEKTVESAVFDAKTEADGALEVKRLECETAAARAASVEAEARSATTAAVERVTVAEERVVLAELARDNAERELLNAAKLARASAARADAAESASRRHLEEASAAFAEADDAASLAVELEQCRVRESDLETKVAEQQVRRVGAFPHPTATVCRFPARTYCLLHTSQVHCFTEAGDCFSLHRDIQYTCTLKTDTFCSQ